MKINDLVRLRIENQRLNKTKFGDPGEVVNWFCAMQAQDYLGALWSVGQRLEKSTETEIEKAIADRRIVRTWPMRGTLHFVSPVDVRWMLRLLTPRIIVKTKSLYQQQGLDSKIFTKSKKIIERTLAKHGQLTRAELYKALMKEKIAVNEQRGIHIIGHAAQEGLICLGPRSGKQHTFVLLDEWIPKSRNITTDESLAELGSRYLDSHGPATIQDFSWWSGLTLAEVKRSLDMIQEKWVSFRIDDQDYFMKPPNAVSKRRGPQVSLLSWFDEYIIGYKDRSAAFDPETEKFIEKPKNGIYTPVILIDGKIAGNWKRSFEKQHVKIEVEPFRKFNEQEKKAIDQALQEYRSFLSMPA
jgi:hypothetical protein